MKERSVPATRNTKVVNEKGSCCGDGSRGRMSEKFQLHERLLQGRVKRKIGGGKKYSLRLDHLHRAVETGILRGDKGEEGLGPSGLQNVPASVDTAYDSSPTGV